MNTLSGMTIERATRDPQTIAEALRAGQKVWPNIVGFLAADHRTVEGWFAGYVRAPDFAAKQALLKSILMALRAHMAIEEELFYPEARAHLGDDRMIDHAIHEHAEAREIMEKMTRSVVAPPDAENLVERELDTLASNLQLAVAAHIQEEETRLFPAVEATGINLFAIGAAAAALRVERLQALAASFPAPRPQTSPRG